jgi:hypothetical protein
MSAHVRRLPAALAAAAVSLLGTPGHAEPPDLDSGGFVRGEVEAEVNAWLRQSRSTLRPELELGLADGLGLELQADLERRPGDWSVEALSVQISRDITATGSFGLAFELGVQPAHGDLQAEAFAYATREMGPWRVDLNAGLEREGGAFAAAYAWRLVRPLDDRWSLGLEGGGQVDLATGHDEYLIGPVVRWRLNEETPEITFGATREDGGHYGLRLGLELPF